MKNYPFVKDQTGKYLTLDPVDKNQIIDLAYKLLIPEFMNNTFISSPIDCVEFLKIALADCSREKFSIVFLSTRNQVIDFKILFEGTISGATIGNCQGSCSIDYLTVSRSFSGLSATLPTGSQFRVAPDRRVGCRSLAA